MNKKIYSVGVSFTLHVVLLALAYNTVIYTFAPPKFGDLPLYIHVRVDSKLLSSPKAHEGKKASIKAPAKAQENPSAPENYQKSQNIPIEHTVTLTAQATTSPTDKPFISIVKETAPMEASQTFSARRSVPVALVSNEDISKDLTVSTSSQSLSPVVSSYKPLAAGAQAGGAGKTSSFTGLADSQENTSRLSFQPTTSAGDIKSFLGYDLRTYEDPSDHSRYFKLSMRVGDVPGGLAVIPKEIVFLVDSSNSIGQPVLEQFKQGVEDCFNLLGRNDRFNVIVFKHNTVVVNKESLSNIPDDINKAKYFLDDTMANSDTDVYEAVLKSINLKKSMKPSYVLLISDGQPTAGLTAPQQIINQIAQINQGRVPIFSFGAGMFLERYLASFLAFTNRGWAVFGPNEIARGIVDMYKQIKDPVLINLRYYVSGLDSQEMYPKGLPDLFKGSQFVLYGRYTKEQSFYFQLFGQAKDELKQYLIGDDISQAPRGDSRIAQEWAIRKVYYMIGQLEYNKDNKDLIAEIKKLQKKFHLNLSSFVLEQINRGKK